MLGFAGSFVSGLRVFLLGVLGCIFVMDAVLQGINTINRLDGVESERDRWQKPSEVIAALRLAKGDVVADLGSGAGYFALKLSRSVGASGRVLAVDIRRLPLTFLWMRAFLNGRRNVSAHLGDADDPHLPRERLDGVLIANAYHELANPASILSHALNSLRPAARLVILDRNRTAEGSDEAPGHHHQIDLGAVVRRLQEAGFEIVLQQERFIDRPYGEQWRLVVARRPLT